MVDLTRNQTAFQHSWQH